MTVIPSVRPSVRPSGEFTLALLTCPPPATVNTDPAEIYHTGTVDTLMVSLGSATAGIGRDLAPHSRSVIKQVRVGGIEAGREPRSVRSRLRPPSSASYLPPVPAITRFYHEEICFGGSFCPPGRMDGSFCRSASRSPPALVPSPQ